MEHSFGEEEDPPPLFERVGWVNSDFRNPKPPGAKTLSAKTASCVSRRDSWKLSKNSKPSRKKGLGAASDDCLFFRGAATALGLWKCREVKLHAPGKRATASAALDPKCGAFKLTPPRHAKTELESSRSSLTRNVLRPCVWTARHPGRGSRLLRRWAKARCFRRESSCEIQFQSFRSPMTFSSSLQASCGAREAPPSGSEGATEVQKVGGVGAEEASSVHSPKELPEDVNDDAEPKPSGLTVSETTSGDFECESLSRGDSEDAPQSDEPLVGCMKPLSVFQYRLIPNSNASKQLAALCTCAEMAAGRASPPDSEAAAFREVRRDGCCFYRAFLFSLFELLSRDANKLNSFKTLLEEDVFPQVLKAGYRKDDVEEFFEGQSEEKERWLLSARSGFSTWAGSRDALYAETYKALEHLRVSPSTASVEEIFNDAPVSNHIVVCAKLACGAEMKTNAETYEPFLEGFATTEEFVKVRVEPMWVAAEQLQIMALARILETTVSVVYVDQGDRKTPQRYSFHEGKNLHVTLLYLPGHYDVLYLPENIVFD